MNYLHLYLLVNEAKEPAKWSVLWDFKKKWIHVLTAETSGLLFVQPIDYPGFKLFMEICLEAEIPDELCQHLFLSFMKKGNHSMPGFPLTASNSAPASIGKDFHVKDVAVVASQTICAPITNLTSEIHYEKEPSSQPSSRPHSSLAEKIHGLTEKLQHGLGHVRHDSGGDPGRRSRAGRFGSSVAFMAAVTSFYFVATSLHAVLVFMISDSPVWCLRSPISLVIYRVFRASFQLLMFSFLPFFWVLSALMAFSEFSFLSVFSLCLC